MVAFEKVRIRFLDCTSPGKGISTYLQGGPGICITNYLCRYLLRIDGFYSNSYVILSPANNYTNLT